MNYIFITYIYVYLYSPYRCQGLQLEGGEDTSPEERGGIPLSVFIILFPGEGPVKASGWIGPWNNYFYKQLIYSLY